MPLLQWSRIIVQDYTQTVHFDSMRSKLLELVKMNVGESPMDD